jgi:hypothetical protein
VNTNPKVTRRVNAQHDRIPRNRIQGTNCRRFTQNVI